MLRHRLLQLPRHQKRLLQVAIDVVLIWLAIWLAFVVRLGSDFHHIVRPLGEHAWLFLTAPLLSLPLFIRMGLYRAVLRYFGSDALLTIFKATSISALLLALAIYWRGEPAAVVPRSLVINYWLFSLLLIGGLRLGLRHYLVGHGLLPSPLGPLSHADQLPPRVAIYGAGAAGNQAVAALRMSRQMRPVAFIDDDPNLHGSIISGLQVYPAKQIGKLIKETHAEEVLLAIPSATRARRREILTALEEFPVHVRSVPAFNDLATGRVKVEDIQEVDIADLLGRDPVPPRGELLDRCIRGKSVMVTGAGGSIGSELCRQVAANGAAVLVLYEQCEFNLYRILQELQTHGIERRTRVVSVLGSVGNQSRLLSTLTKYRVDTVYHAAAYKHVPIVEENISEGVLNNVLGTLQAAQAALRAGVTHFVLISTDKAVRPTNIMGASKRLAEMILQALAQQPSLVLENDPPHVNQLVTTCFSMVRFGNVLGSSGSVIPKFREQIRRGGPVTVTHPNITRYFMTIPEAAQLVIQAGAMATGGDVFVLDMGKPVRIADLAEKMVHLSGLTVSSERNTDGDIAIEYIGLRPGEKLFEELLIGDDATQTSHPSIMRAHEVFLPWPQLQSVIQTLVTLTASQQNDALRELLMATVFDTSCTPARPDSRDSQLQ